MATGIIGASVIAGILLVLAGFMANRELRERIQFEKFLEKEKLKLTEIIRTQQEVATAGLSLEKVMTAIVSRVEKISSAEAAVIEILEGQELVYRAASEAFAHTIGTRIPVQGSLAGLCIQESRLLYCEDSETDPRVNSDACRAIGVRSMLVVPLHYDDTVIGVLKAFSSEPEAFDESDQSCLKLVAGLLASSIAYAQQFEDRQQAEIIAIEASRQKSDFLANMSHEIRTPINGIVGMSHLLEATNLSAEQMDFIEAIQRSAEALLTIVNDILDFSKIEAGKIDIENFDFDLDQVISDLGKLVSWSAREKGLTFSVKSPGAWSYLLSGDQGRLRQILLNLLNNAVKFTEQGGVEFRVELLEESESGCVVLFEVEDSGIGISEAGLERIFQAFHQADPSTTRRFGGTGLGLSISKCFVELMGGEIGVRSVEGQGSIFWVKLPFVKSSLRKIDIQSDLAPMDYSLGQGQRIIVAEDNLINQKVALGFLEKLGYQASAVNNGLELLDELKNGSFDLILMDCQMPLFDGYQTTEAIRIHPQHKIQNIPIVAMTANAVEGDRERCLAIGMNDYISKPIKIRNLALVLSRWLDKEALVQSLAESPLDEDLLSSMKGMKTGDDSSFLTDLIDIYLNAAPDRLKRMNEHLEQNNLVGLAAEAHALKGASGQLGLKLATQICGEIELAAQSGDFQLVGQKLKHLQLELENAQLLLAEIRAQELAS